MTDEPKNLVLEYLRRIDEKADRLSDDVREIKGRLSSLERHVAVIQSDIAEMRHSIDRHGDRLARIDRRLELSEPFTPART